jgi:hypothetical protein
VEGRYPLVINPKYLLAAGVAGLMKFFASLLGTTTTWS